MTKWTEANAIKRNWRVAAQWYLSAPRTTDNPEVQTAEWIDFPQPLELTCVAGNAYSAAYAFAKKHLRNYGFHRVKVDRIMQSNQYTIRADSDARCTVTVEEIT